MINGEQRQTQPNTDGTELLGNSEDLRFVPTAGAALPNPSLLSLFQLYSEGVPPATKRLEVATCVLHAFTFNHFQHTYYNSTPPSLQRKDSDPNLHTAEHVSHLEGVTLLPIS